MAIAPPINALPDEAIMLQATQNIIEIHKANEAEKIGCLKYYGFIAMTVVTVTAGIFRFGNDPTRDYVTICALLLLTYLLGLVMLRKLVAIRANIVKLSIEFGNIHKFFIDRYQNLGEYLGKSFEFKGEEYKKTKKFMLVTQYVQGKLAGTSSQRAL